MRWTKVLIKSGKADDKTDNYMLVVETQKSWDHKETDKSAGVQRVLDRDERVLLAQSKWKGSGRFILRKNSNAVSCSTTRASMMKICMALHEIFKALLCMNKQDGIMLYEKYKPSKVTLLFKRI